MSKIKVAITGAGGQVGSVLAKRLCESADFGVIALCRNRMSAGLIHSVAPKCDVRIGSITDVASAQDLMGDCSTIINCAIAMVSGNPRMSRSINRAMVDNFSKLRNLRSLIHMSSVSVYGDCIDNSKFPRSTFERPRTNSDYGRSKLNVEEYVKRMCEARKVDYHILRLGHVIGPRMDRSKLILELAGNPKFYLPFDGELPSNTIHVEVLAELIIAILLNSQLSGIHNAADKNRSWRQVFDWHTGSVGLPPVREMTRSRSEMLRNYYSSRSVVRDVGSWLRSLPVLGLVRYPAVFEFSYRLLAILPPSVTRRLATFYKRKEVGRQIASAESLKEIVPGPEYFSDGMPGDYLMQPGELSGKTQELHGPSRDLNLWYQMISQADWLPSLSKHLVHEPQTERRPETP